MAKMIDLSLTRMCRLLAQTPQPWRAVHVAGTNGKGSICAYTSALLHARKFRCGMFTSPHLLDRWDCITVGEKPVSEALFRDVQDKVKQKDRNDKIGATEFELLTAIAFEIFNREEVKVGVVETGLGGRLDATNAMKSKDVAIICKIGLDHHAFLGNSLAEIAIEKAGILRGMKQGGIAILHPQQDSPAQEAILTSMEGLPAMHVVYPNGESNLCKAMAAEGFEEHQILNLALAEFAAKAIDGSMAADDWTLYAPVIRNLQWPGRLQRLDLGSVVGRPKEVLLDGAHNPQSAEILAVYVQKHLRTTSKPVTWVLAATKGKDVEGIFELLLEPGDRVAAVRFEPVDGMPWVEAAEPSELLGVAARLGVPHSELYDGKDDVGQTLIWAAAKAGDDPVVIAGSLYLVSSVLRLLRSSSEAMA